mgnify:CR=1 FL=1
MSGHSKFANIKHKKEKNDAKKGKIFTIIGREIVMAVKAGGPDPNNNGKLRDVIAKAKANNMPNDTIDRGIKKAAGDAILGLCKSMTSPEPISIGQYRGFDMELSFDTFSREYKITLIHQLRHTVTLGTDIFGNIQRLDNTLGAFEERMAACTEQLENTRVQLENAKAEVQKPFPQEEELKTKSARLNELNAMLNLDKRENEIVDGERGEEEPQKSSADRER